MPSEAKSTVGKNGSPPMKRKSMPKVRTGCLTCRKRRIKCDEAKPECQRCRIAERHCLGFGYSTATSFSSNHRHMSSLRVSSADFNPVNARLKLAVLRPKRYVVPSISLPCTDTEHRYFLLFQNHSAKDLAGYFPSLFWNRLLLQEGHSDDSIRNAMIAIGALYKMVEASRTSPTAPATKAEALRHFESALQHYQLAICRQRDALQLQNSPDALRNCLISCLLFICFEILQGDCASVEKQVLSGLRLLQLHSSTSKSESRSLKSNENHVSCVEGELCQIFARLEIQLRTFDDARPQTYSLPGTKRKSSSSNIPGNCLPPDFASFDTLQEARRSWDLLMPKVMEIHHRGSSYRPFIPDDEVPPEIRSEVTAQLQVLESWKSSFEPVFKQAWTSNDDTARCGVSILKISWLYTYMMSSTTLEYLETAYDTLLPIFREIIHLATYLLDQKRSSMLGDTIFVFDATLILPVLFVVMKCRFWDLRHVAINLLRSAQRREGIWDSNVAAHVGAWLAAVEEEGLQPDEFIAEEKRVRLVDLNFDLQKKTAWVQCGRPVSGTNGFSHLKEIDFSW